MTTTAEVSATAGVPGPGGWVAGTWEIDPAHTTVSFAVSSVSTGHRMRDDHLRSADFFDAGRVDIVLDVQAFRAA